jgi:hypothetical protein
MANSSQRILDCLMHSFTNSVGLTILDSCRHLMYAVLDEHRLEWATSEFTTLVEYTSKWMRVASKPTVIKQISYMLQTTILDPNYFLESSCCIDDYQCLDLQCWAMNVDGPRTN